MFLTNTPFPLPAHGLSKYLHHKNIFGFLNVRGKLIKLATPLLFFVAMPVHSTDPSLVCEAQPLKVSIFLPNGLYGGGIYSVVTNNNDDSQPIPTSWHPWGSGSCSYITYGFTHQGTAFEVDDSLGCSPGWKAIPDDAVSNIRLNGFEFFCRQSTIAQH